VAPEGAARHGTARRGCSVRDRAQRSAGGGRAALTDMYFPRGLTAFLKTSNTFLGRAFFLSLPPPFVPTPFPLSLPRLRSQAERSHSLLPAI